MCDEYDQELRAVAGGEAFVWVSCRWGLDVWSYCRCRHSSLPRCAVLRETECRTSTIEVIGWFARVIMSICSVRFKTLPALRRMLRPGQAKLHFLKKAIKKRTQNGVRFLNLFLDPDRCPLACSPFSFLYCLLSPLAPLLVFLTIP